MANKSDETVEYLQLICSKHGQVGLSTTKFGFVLKDLSVSSHPEATCRLDLENIEVGKIGQKEVGALAVRGYLIFETA